MSLEKRVAVEVRARDRKLAGYAARFNVEAKIADFVEVIKPGAFSASLKSGRDILALADHDPKAVLARTRSGTLRLSEDSSGLAFEISLPDTTAARDALALAERGDLGGASFAFLVPKGGETWEGNKRTLSMIDLHEVSIVSAWPAYPETTVSARAKTPKLSLARLWLATVR